jgi:hypothetical protein
VVNLEDDMKAKHIHSFRQIEGSGEYTFFCIYCLKIVVIQSEIIDGERGESINPVGEAIARGYLDE